MIIILMVPSVITILLYSGVYRATTTFIYYVDGQQNVISSYYVDFFWILNRENEHWWFPSALLSHRAMIRISSLECTRGSDQQ